MMVRNPTHVCKCLYCALERVESGKKVQPPAVKTILNDSVTIEKISTVVIDRKGSEETGPVIRDVNCLNSNQNPSEKAEMHKCVCGNSYSQKENLERHVKYSCDMTRERMVKSEAVTEVPPILKLNCECGIGFTCVFDLIRHKSSYCRKKTTVEKAFRCGCGVAFDNIDQLAGHRGTGCEEPDGGDPFDDVDSSSRSRTKYYKCGCGRSFSRRGLLNQHQYSGCRLNFQGNPQKNESQRTYECECGKKCWRACDYTRHRNFCPLLRQKAVEKAVDKGTDHDQSKETSINKCECGLSFSRRARFILHKKEQCLLTKKVDSASPKVRTKDTERKAVRIKVNRDRKASLWRCKCGSSFSFLKNLNRHKARSCHLFKGKVTRGKADTMGKKGTAISRNTASNVENASWTTGTKLPSKVGTTVSTTDTGTSKRGAAVSKPGKRSYRRKERVYGSEIHISKRWGTIRGPPFVCKCGASYMTYVSWSFHKNKTCRLNSGSQLTLRAEDSTQGPEDPNAQIKLENANATNAVDASAPPPAPDAVFDLKTAKKFNCPCGEIFYSEVSLNGHKGRCQVGPKLKKQPLERCMICCTKFMNRAALVSHVQKAHRVVSNYKIGANVKKIETKSQPD